MRISYLREFAEIVRCRSFSKAAQNLNTTQSSLSKHIIALEKECSSELLDRSSAQVIPTHEGRVLLEAAFSIVALHDDALAKIKIRKKYPPIALGGLYLNTYTAKLIKASLISLKETMPVSIVYSADHTNTYAQALLDGNVDVVFTIVPPEVALPLGIKAIHLFDDPLVAIVRITHPLASKSSVSLLDINKQKLISPEGDFSIAGAQIIKDLFRLKGVFPSYRPVYLQGVQDFPTLDIFDEILIVEKSLAEKQLTLVDCVVLPISDQEAIFPFCALYRTERKDEAYLQYLEELKINAKSLS